MKSTAEDPTSKSITKYIGILPTEVNPRRPGGCLNTPSGFSQIAGKRRRGAPPFLAQLFIHLSRTLCENFGPRSLMVRSPGYVK